jgi:membrane glycosyltransferase
MNGISAPFPRLRRWLFGGLVFGTTLGGVDMMLDIIGAGGFVGLEIVILTLFTLTFGWISIAFWNAVIGFVLTALRRDPLSLGYAQVTRETGRVTSRTALVMPVHNEDPALVTSSVAAMLRSLDRTGTGDQFDAFLLSDTTDPMIAQAEEVAFEKLRQQLDRSGAVRYRRRVANIGRKAGNIEDFCHRWGSDYDFMVVLDADSIMTGRTLVELVRAMEATPGAGLIQTVPTPACRTTLFGRLLQFAACLYSPMLAAGQSFWQTDAANYWGHNAIIRVRAFAECCRLPVLSGCPPLGGPILSHDFVEAALLRRAGWGVYLLSCIGGSYEDVPGNILDYTKRDHRWCQGSLQHLWLLSGRGFHGMSRLHFVLGAMGYISSVLWFLMLLASTAYIILPYVSLGLWDWDGSVFYGQVPGVPTAIGMNVERIIPLFWVTVVILFLPKLLALILALARQRPSFDGGAHLLSSAVLEMLFAVVVAPLMMFYHVCFVLSVFAGRGIEWEAQVRVGRAVAWTEAWRRTGGVTAVGVTWAGLTLYYSPPFFLWLAPIFVGLLCAGPIVFLTSSLSLGQLARRWGLFLVPSELVPPPELWETECPVTDATGLGLVPRRSSH